MKPKLWVAALFATSAVGCGSRTGLVVDEPVVIKDAAVPADDGPPPPDCTKALDCDSGDKCAPMLCVGGKCVAGPVVTCDDGDECTDDRCEPTTGTCVFTPSTFDNDKDGHRGPKPGHKPGDPGSCGDDCDDTSPAAFPGNAEICDGVDNDCNGVVDDGARYVPADPTIDAVRVSGDIAPASPGGLAWNGASYMSGYVGTIAGKARLYSTALSPDGTKLAPEAPFSKITADQFEGNVVWTGEAHGITWSDRRTSSWEVYFNRTNVAGEKLGPDVRVSGGDETWSINATTTWTGSEFAIVWQDARDFDPSFSLYAQRLDIDGKAIGDNIKLTDGEGGSPAIATGTGTLGVAWTHTEGKRHDVYFQVFDRTFKPISGAEPITDAEVSGVYPTVIWNVDRYVVAWYDPDRPKHAVWGAAIGEKGETLVKRRALTDSVRFSRYPALRPLGDRLLLIWSDTKDGNAGYELYTKMLDKNLAPIDVERRITRAAGDSIFPIATFGPKGDVGVVFRDDRLGALHVYFSRLVCAAGT